LSLPGPDPLGHDPHVELREELRNLFELVRRRQPDELHSWRSLARCKGLDPELFFPSRGEDLRTPKAVCRVCPVQAECGEYALSAGEKEGIWGGLSGRERRQLRKAQRLGDLEEAS
jgi:WhiB family transcriptional regulator, redox-sensing transcriptional regulator